ncbi:MAG TPA: ester cyclase [Chloroflexota bacterium]|nr:ester cyclase [Chloroflexota bacterium]
MIERNKELVRQLLEDDISRGDACVAEQIIHPDFVDHTNPPGMQHGLAGHNAIVSLFRAAFPDQWWEIHDLIAEGDKVVARTTMRGTHLGDFFGIPATGRSVTLPGVHVLRIADGRIAEHWGSNDDLGLMRQLGVVQS